MEPTAQTENERPPVCPEHGLRTGVQGRDFCDVVDDFGHCGRFLIYDYGESTRGSDDAQR